MQVFNMDLVSKYRLIGAAIWLLALVLVVPAWYNNPVNFSPEGEMVSEEVSTLPVVDHAYRLPIANEKPLTDGQAEYLASIDQTASKKVNTGAIEPVEVIRPAYIDKVSGDLKYSSQWIVRLQAFNNIKQANELADKVEANYDVYIKYFEKTRVYSVRTGPYLSQSKAEKDREKLDKMLRTNGEVVQLP